MTKIEKKIHISTDKNILKKLNHSIYMHYIYRGVYTLQIDPGKRPDMNKVAGQVSKLYLESKNWADQIGLPTDISVSMAPR